MAEKKLTFEQAMARLEEIVAQLEAGTIPWLSPSPSTRRGQN